MALSDQKAIRTSVEVLDVARDRSTGRVAFIYENKGHRRYLVVGRGP
ncbi:hypothetical protein OP10G_0649 [Fimbriimonas ginsengisoli Gsoil 348]|uniref:Uncharacterized protein n=1 Tax=Fimbriimonas ginsengisoli Gsoil 348 TaxID=661478 RepID=A0A068NKQ7_FIMGI|nr:hypothetical protein OP10G_0649 [Fimbriimonas ginsengisoli Gsoil 348]